ncbi:MAG: cation:proton antiporter [Thermomicrobiales bacterium]
MQVLRLAEQLRGSGVLAAVAAGIVFGYRSSRTMTPEMRSRNRVMWEQVMTVFEGLIFILIGFELGALQDILSREDLQQVILHSLAVLAAMMVARFVYVFAGTWIFRSHIPIESRHRDRFGRRYIVPEPAPLTAAGLFIIAWSGLRGVVSLATALALPLVTDAGAPFDHRNEIILITAAVIVGTLFGFGLPLPWLLRRLKLAEDGSQKQEMRLAMTTMRGAMFSELRVMVAEDPSLKEMAAPMLAHFEEEIKQNGDAEEDELWEDLDEQAEGRGEFRRRLMDAARNSVLELRDRGMIGDEVLREVEHDLDLQALLMMR